MRHFSFIVLLLLAPLASAQTLTPPLLRKAVERWMGERDNWAFTLHVREFDGGKVKEERTERYDPSKPGIERWQLLTVDGKSPTEARRTEWQKHKTKKRKNAGKPLDDYLDRFWFHGVACLGLLPYRIAPVPTPSDIGARAGYTVSQKLRRKMHHIPDGFRRALWNIRHV